MSRTGTFVLSSLPQARRPAVASVTEFAPNLFRISVFVPESKLQFNHFLVRDDEPLLFHTGLRHMCPEARNAVATVVPPSKLRWISFSHFESDECGALNEWLSAAPQAETACGVVGALVASTISLAVLPAR